MMTQFWIEPASLRHGSYTIPLSGWPPPCSNLRVVTVLLQEPMEILIQGHLSYVADFT